LTISWQVRALLSLGREDPALAVAVSIRAQELLQPPGRVERGPAAPR
jgi:hypothetical protein